MTNVPPNPRHRRKNILSNGNMEMLLVFIGTVAFSLIGLVASFFNMLPPLPDDVIPRFHRSPTLPQANQLKQAYESNAFEGKERFIEIMKEMDIDPTSIEDEKWRQVPTWDVVEELYGSQPIVYGLDRCQEFRENTPAAERRVAVAGMFNSGTNAVAILLQHNCQIPARVKKKGPRKGHGMEWQVPWGKHTPAQFRNQHTIQPGKPGSDSPKDYVLPVVSIRDPYEWMKSMCRHPYTARWPHRRRCPQLVNNRKKPNRLTLKRVAGGQELPYDSLAHLWNDWYREYYSKATYPKLIVRFEDLIFYPKETTEIVCKCAGGVVMANNFGKVTPGKFQYLIQSAKVGPAHGKVEERTDLMTAWIKYGKRKNWGDFPSDDLAYAQKVLDKEMMDTFRYSGPTV